MLGGSAYFNDLYLIYYGIKATAEESDIQGFEQNGKILGKNK